MVSLIVKVESVYSFFIKNDYFPEFFIPFHGCRIVLSMFANDTYVVPFRYFCFPLFYDIMNKKHYDCILKILLYKGKRSTLTSDLCPCKFILIFYDIDQPKTDAHTLTFTGYLQLFIHVCRQVF